MPKSKTDMPKLKTDMPKSKTKSKTKLKTKSKTDKSSQRSSGVTTKKSHDDTPSAVNRARSKVDNKSRGSAGKTKMSNLSGDYGHSIAAKPSRCGDRTHSSTVDTQSKIDDREDGASPGQGCVSCGCETDGRRKHVSGLDTYLPEGDGSARPKREGTNNVTKRHPRLESDGHDRDTDRKQDGDLCVSLSKGEYREDGARPRNDDTSTVVKKHIHLAKGSGCDTDSVRKHSIAKLKQTEKEHPPLAMGSESCSHDTGADRKHTGGLGTSLSKDDDSEDGAGPGHGETSTVMTGQPPPAMDSKSCGCDTDCDSKHSRGLDRSLSKDDDSEDGAGPGHGETSTVVTGQPPPVMGGKSCGCDTDCDSKHSRGLDRSLSKDDDSEDGAGPGHGETSTVMTGQPPPAMGGKSCGCDTDCDSKHSRGLDRSVICKDEDREDVAISSAMSTHPSLATSFSSSSGNICHLGSAPGEPPSRCESTTDIHRHVHDFTGEEDTPNVSKECPICLGPFVLPTMLSICKHVFCESCIKSSFRVKQECPICRKGYGIIYGTQPANGTMRVIRDVFSLPGYYSHGTIIIHYDIPDGVQTVSACIPVCPNVCTHPLMYPSAIHTLAHLRTTHARTQACPQTYIFSMYTKHE